MSYQDRWVRGKVVETGDRECETRWHAIRDFVLSDYERPFTMLEIGADLGYFSLRAAAEFGCVAVAIDGGPQLTQSFKRNDLDGTIALRHRLSVEDLLTLGACEHFDVVLALNVLHHFPDPGPVLDAVLRLGDETVIETPPAEDLGACGQGVIAALAEMVESEDPLEIARTPSHTTEGLDRPMFLLETPKKSISRSYFNSPSVVPLSPVYIDSTYKGKSVRFARKDEKREWIHGINLRTFQRLGGAYPDLETVSGMVRNYPLPQKRHGDIRPWNFILNGSGVHLIDGGDDRAIYDDAEGREKSATMVAQGGGAL